VNLLLSAFIIFVGGSFLSLGLVKYPRVLRVVGPGSVVIGSVLGIQPVLSSLILGTCDFLQMPWQIPMGSMSIGIDPLSAIFAIAILFVSPLAAVFGAGYLKSFEDTHDLGKSWFFFNLLVASMLLVVLARNALLFLIAWEVMSLASFFLVVFEHERDSVRRAGWIYFIATHIGTAFLLVMFLLLGRHAGSLEFSTFFNCGLSSHLVSVVFVFAVIGFGTKAGFMPFHVWLPEAHPAAPSHVSALMSGVMIKTGIYGLLRTLTFLGCPPAWWGWTIIIIGVVSGICGVLFALAQHDIKRLLAYHSVENIGIIALGLGVGLLGVSHGNAVVAFLGFAGGLLHVVNHAVFKSLLFLGAGSVLHSAGTREIDHLGGLIKKMPLTATAFLIGSAAICGLPPLNGFVSEFFIYVGAFEGMSRDGLSSGAAIGGILAITALALIGGLAVACFTKAFGIVFLGEPRSKHCEHAHESCMSMRIPMVLLSLACVAMGLWGFFAFGVMSNVTSVLTSGLTFDPATCGLITPYQDVLLSVTLFALALIVVIGSLIFLRSWLMSGRIQQSAVTWDCGYLAPNSRMQYTASSFAQPITKFFRTFLQTKRYVSPPEGFFPKTASFSSETDDFYGEQVYKPTFNALESWLSRFRQIQHGQLNLYIMYIIIALVVLFVWKLR